MASVIGMFVSGLFLFVGFGMAAIGRVRFLSPDREEQILAELDDPTSPIMIEVRRLRMERYRHQRRPKKIVGLVVMAIGALGFLLSAWGMP